jgi:lysophospholipase L1-like esterase
MNSLLKAIPVSAHVLSIILILFISCGGGGSSPTPETIPPSATPVLCFGTSLTSGDTSGIAWILEDHAEELGIRVISRGFGGHSSYLLLEHLEEAVSVRAPIVLIEAVMNDALIIDARYTPVEQSRVYVTEIVQAFQDTGAKVFLMTTNPDLDEPTMRPDLEDYYQMVREVAADTGAELIDLYPLWTRYSYGELHEMIPDHVHPSMEALDTIAFPEIVRALPIPI